MRSYKPKADPRAELILLRLEAYGLDVATGITRSIWRSLTNDGRVELYFQLRALGLSAREIATLIGEKPLEVALGELPHPRTDGAT